MEGCARRVRYSGLCSSHLYIWEKAKLQGTESELGWSRLEPRVAGSLLERLLGLIDFVDDKTGCWIGANSTDQVYSTVNLKGKTHKTHRVMYEEVIGPIPSGLFIDHTCKNRRCINPFHMEPVSNRENVLRGSVCSKTKCPKGHVYDEENTGFKRAGAVKHRYCKACARLRSKERKQKLKLLRGQK